MSPLGVRRDIVVGWRPTKTKAVRHAFERDPGQL
jgi:hypothetical protein